MYSYLFLICGEQWYNGSYTMMAKTIRALELYYPMIQFLINAIANTGIKSKVYFYFGPDESIVLK